MSCYFSHSVPTIFIKIIMIPRVDKEDPEEKRVSKDLLSTKVTRRGDCQFVVVLVNIKCTLICSSNSAFAGRHTGVRSSDDMISRIHRNQ